MLPALLAGLPRHGTSSSLTTRRASSPPAAAP